MRGANERAKLVNALLTHELILTTKDTRKRINHDSNKARMTTSREIPKGNQGDKTRQEQANKRRQVTEKTRVRKINHTNNELCKDARNGGVLDQYL